MTGPLLLATTLAGMTPPTVDAQVRPVLRLDHAVLVVRNLDSAQSVLDPWGFRFKPGRLHHDHLLNRHIKFRDGTALELMALAGPPTGTTASDYAHLLAEGPGGAYIAILCDDLGPVARAASRLGLAPHRSQSGTWQFLSFRPPSDASGIFFGSGWESVRDPDSVVTHPNGATGLREAWVAGGPGLDHLLQALGVNVRDSVRLPDGRMGGRWVLGTGALVIARPTISASRRRPFGVVIESRGGIARPTGQPFSGFWLSFQP